MIEQQTIAGLKHLERTLEEATRLSQNIYQDLEYETQQWEEKSNIESAKNILHSIESQILKIGMTKEHLFRIIESRDI